MVIDTIDQFEKYTCIPRYKAIASFLKKTNLLALREGEIPIQGKDLYVKVLKYEPKKADENNFETHRIYTDIQVILEGIEDMQIAPLSFLERIDDCHVEGDFEFFSGNKYISNIVLQKGQFVVFFPGEAHKPGCRHQESDALIMKLVFKVK